MVDVAEVKCDHPTSTKDGFIEVSNFRGSYVYGSRATYHCNPGYILWGNSTRWEEFPDFDVDTFDLASSLDGVESLGVDFHGMRIEIFFLCLNVGKHNEVS